MSQPPLPLPFYARDVVRVARDLLGKRLVRLTDEGLAAGWIVEVEAYLASGDSACHASRGRTRRNQAMFGPPGRAYVYAIHSRYCVNVVTEAVDVPSAVLIRAIEPTSGLDPMRRRRGTDDPFQLARGPARLCEALAIDRALDGHDLTLGTHLWIEENADPTMALARPNVAVSPRIGVTSAKELPLRFYVADSRYVSRRR
jgi:DNA-3-methyladenine glycosylase